MPPAPDRDDGVDRARLNAAMARLADGDRAAFDEVFVVAQPLVHRLMARLLGARQPAELDDAVQRTLITVFEQAHRYEPARDAAAWICTLAWFEVRSVVRDAARRRARLVAVDTSDAASLADPRVDPEQLAADREALSAVEACLGSLSASDRATLQAHWSGQDQGAGATFRKRVERATRRLFGQWRSHGHDSPP